MRDLFFYLAGVLTIPALLLLLSVIMGSISLGMDENKKLFDWKKEYKD